MPGNGPPRPRQSLRAIGNLHEHENKVRRAVEAAEKSSTAAINAQNRYLETKGELIECKGRVAALQDECLAAQDENARLNDDKDRLNEKILQLEEAMATNATTATVTNAAAAPTAAVPRMDREVSVPASSIDATERPWKLPDPAILTDGKDPEFEDWHNRIIDKLTYDADRFVTEGAKAAYVIHRTGGDAASHINAYRFSDNAYFKNYQMVLDVLMVEKYGAMTDCQTETKLVV